MLSEEKSRIACHRIRQKYKHITVSSLCCAILHGTFYIPEAFLLGTDLSKYFRILLLGYRQIKTTLKLRHKTVIMSMIYPRLCTVTNGISRFNECRSVYHIFIKNRIRNKSAQVIITASAIHGTGIGNHIGFDAEMLLVRLCFL